MVAAILIAEWLSSYPGTKYWHGASRTTAMTHIAIQQALGGNVVGWLEQVSDEQVQTGEYKGE